MSCMPSAAYTSASHDELYPITVHIQNAYGGMTPVQALADTGNQRTIFKKEVADLLGLNLAQGSPIYIGGINGEPREFRTLRLLVKIGTLSEPIPVTVGFATHAGDLVENLIGNADILKSGKFQVIYDEKGVTYREKPNDANIAACSMGDNDQAFMNNNYEQLMTGTPKALGYDPNKKKDMMTISNLAYGLYY